jgi:transcriptional regulator with XRE-family HTH domain
MSGLAKRLGTCVRELRLAAGLTQVEFAERCGFYQTYLSRVETGRANPSLNALEVLANGLGMSVFDLFEQVRNTK